ncbi:MAG: tRNA pseudouridine(38-40) synthase TruA [Bacilli bacterium]|nr:tRNA pseudouridine(38-40) synthase TruA [Bacilli bacterium]
MKYLATLSYFGAAYSGFQRQKNRPSIQGEVEEKLSFLLGEPTLIKGAGRTDAGVNATGQRFSFETKKAIPDLDAFCFAANRLLPEDISLKGLRPVKDDFDARHSSCGKTYVYRFYFGIKDPFTSLTSAYLTYRNFDEDAFRAGLKVFEGTHDFSNFTSKAEDKDAFIRTLAPIQVAAKDGHYAVTFSGNGFMTYMIRFMMGAALKAGLHKLNPDDIRALLEAKPRHIVSFKAPASGLTLTDVRYPDDAY